MAEVFPQTEVQGNSDRPYLEASLGPANAESQAPAERSNLYHQLGSPVTEVTAEPTIAVFSFHGSIVPYIRRVVKQPHSDLNGILGSQSPRSYHINDRAIRPRSYSKAVLESQSLRSYRINDRASN